MKCAKNILLQVTPGVNLKIYIFIGIAIVFWRTIAGLLECQFGIGIISTNRMVYVGVVVPITKIHCQDCK